MSIGLLVLRGVDRDAVVGPAAPVVVAGRQLVQRAEALDFGGVCGDDPPVGRPGQRPRPADLGKAGCSWPRPPASTADHPEQKGRKPEPLNQVPTQPPTSPAPAARHDPLPDDRVKGACGAAARANATSLNLAASCQPVPVTFSSRTSLCPLNVAELL